MPHPAGSTTTRSHNIQDENWRLFINFPTHRNRRKSFHQYHGLNRQRHLQKKLLARWYKIDTLHERSHPQVDWGALKAAIKKSPSRHLGWVIRLSSKELPTGNVITTKGSWPITACLRNYGHITEDVNHIFQCQKGYEIWEDLKNVLLSWGE